MSEYRRHPRDCYLTTPEAAEGLRNVLLQHGDLSALEAARFFDPFGGPGQMLRHASPSAHIHVQEIDERWRAHAEAFVPSFVQANSLVGPWPDDHCITNTPYHANEPALGRVLRHVANWFFAACLLRTDWFQHEDRPRPDCMALLEWRPAMGVTIEKRTGKLKLGTDQFTGYVWAIWKGAGNPLGLDLPPLVWVKRPVVDKAAKLKHRQLAFTAYEWGREDGHGLR